MVTDVSASTAASAAAVGVAAFGADAASEAVGFAVDAARLIVSAVGTPVPDAMLAVCPLLILHRVAARPFAVGAVPRRQQGDAVNVLKVGGAAILRPVVCRESTQNAVIFRDEQYQQRRQRAGGKRAGDNGKSSAVIELNLPQ